jgi:hypothetical protein
VNTRTHNRPIDEEAPGLDHAIAEARGYWKWSQIAGYFDGDGSVYLRTDSPIVLKFALVWVDNSFSQLLQLRKFLQSQGIALGNVLKHTKGVFRLQISSPKSALAAARYMLRFCFKKYDELRILIEYYEERMTGTEVVIKINNAVRSGVRTGCIRKLVTRPKYREGKHIIARARGIRSAEVRRQSRAKSVGTLPRNGARENVGLDERSMKKLAYIPVQSDTCRPSIRDRSEAVLKAARLTERNSYVLAPGRAIRL